MPRWGTRTHSLVASARGNPSSRRHGKRWFAFLLLIAVPVFGWGLEGLDEVSTRVVGALAGRTATDVLLSPSDFFDSERHTSPPLALRLRDRFAAALQKAGFRVAEPRQPMSDVWVIRCSWKRKADRLALTIVATPWKGGARGKLKVISASLPVTDEVDRLVKPDVASYGRTLVHRLELKEHLTQPRRVHLRPVKVSSLLGGTPANDFFDAWMDAAVASTSLLIPLRAEATLAGVDHRTMRIRGFRPVKKPGMSLTGDLLAAQGELSGAVAYKEGAIVVDAALSSDQGEHVSAASVQVPIEQLPAQVVAALKDPAAERMTAESPVSRKGLEVELSTDHGEGTARYRMGQKAAFLVRVNQDAYVYLFDLDSAGGATLLYPAMGVEPSQLTGGQLLLLPDDGMPYDVEASPPPGKDIIWAVATSERLAVPGQLTGNWAKASILTQRIRNMAAGTSAYAEAQLLLTTGP